MRSNFRTTILLLIFRRLFLSRKIGQSSSTNWPRGIKEDLFNYGNIVALFATTDNSDESDMSPYSVDWIVVPFGIVTLGPSIIL